MVHKRQQILEYSHSDSIQNCLHKQLNLFTDIFLHREPYEANAVTDIKNILYVERYNGKKQESVLDLVC